MRSGFPPSPLIAALVNPTRVASLDAAERGLLFQRARRAGVIGRLALDLEATGGLAALDEASRNALEGAVRHYRYRRGLLAREVDLMTRDFVPFIEGPVVALKGAAYLLTGSSAARGRISADLDLLVSEDTIDAAADRLRELGFRPHPDKDNPYDRLYYRRWMHELPPFEHGERHSELDLHFRILPRTHRYQPPIEKLLANVVPAAGGWHVWSPADRVIHAALHFLVDGEGTHPVRHLLELYDLLRDLPNAVEFREAVVARARRLGVVRPVLAALWLVDATFGAVSGADGRLAHRSFAIAVPLAPARRAVLRMVAAEEGRGRAPLAGLFLYVRSHWLRMPPWLLARHLFVKWRWRRQRTARTAAG
ncbi:MAG: hypothetical protein D6757_11410 [Alphaproteobacteria bacterium]|nr:MAG: hypothetical protein D6757_11410 [Alphaproteobacteria bacterium]